MRYDEQYINTELHKIGEQEDVNRIHWIPLKNTNKLIHSKEKDTISQWNKDTQNLFRNRNILEVGLTSRKNKKLNLVVKDKFKLDFNVNLKQKLTRGGCSSPSRFCLRLILPSALKSSFSENDVAEHRQNSLPKIKKLSISKNFLLSHSQNIKKNRSLEKQRPQHPVNEKKNYILWKKQQSSQDKSHMKGKMIGTTCRQIKIITANTQNSRPSQINNQFKECITFIK